MREAKSYRDPYTDVKRTSAMSGPSNAKKTTSGSGLVWLHSLAGPSGWPHMPY